jgi:phospho-N-acetylmuramoyl-pentapeptide-transferase
MVSDLSGHVTALAIGLLSPFLVAIAVSVLLTAGFLPWLRRLTAHASVREDLPDSHKEKAGTPSMGGIPLVLTVLVVVPAFLVTRGVPGVRDILCLFTILAFALVGLADDLRKLTNAKGKGLTARWRLAIEFAVAIAVMLVFLSRSNPAAFMPLLGTGGWPLPLAVLVGAIVIVGGANAFNLADGLDGLASGLAVFAAMALALVAVITDLKLIWSTGVAIPEAAAMGAVPLAIAGAALGFLLFNYKPAKVWMGDVGSLGIGAGLAVTAVMIRAEFLFALIGFVFVAEAVSVILQVISFKTTGKRIFRMAPLHHHFELGGWSELKVVWVFWAVGLLCAAAGVAVAVATMVRWTTPPLS